MFELLRLSDSDGNSLFYTTVTLRLSTQLKFKEQLDQIQSL